MRDGITVTTATTEPSCQACIDRAASAEAEDAAGMVTARRGIVAFLLQSAGDLFVEGKDVEAALVRDLATQIMGTSNEAPSRP